MNGRTYFEKQSGVMITVPE